MNSAMSATDSYAKIIPLLYTNFRLDKVTFRVVSMTGSNQGGNHGLLVLDDSMGVPSAGNLEYSDLMSRGGAMGAKLFSNIASEWVPTEPEDLNYRDAQTNELSVCYAAALPSNTTNDLIVGKLFADIHFTARTINYVSPASLQTLKSICGEFEQRLLARTMKEMSVDNYDTPSRQEIEHSINAAL
jgi:hypothetical protein